jgi:hypothetical protein
MRRRANDETTRGASVYRQAAAPRLLLALLAAGAPPTAQNSADQPQQLVSDRSLVGAASAVERSAAALSTGGGGAATPRRLQAAVDCVGSWGAWSECDVDCGGGVHERTFVVTTVARGGGRACTAADGDTERRLASECAADCPVDCVGAWSDWARCSENCGGGVRSRTFVVSVAAVGAGAACEAEHMATEESSCNVEQCDTMLDCVGGWGQWSACSVPCGGGTHSREYTIETPQLNGGSAATCDIAASRADPQVEACNEQACPVNCRGEWGGWEGCDDPCALNAMAERTYSITTPASAGNPALSLHTRAVLWLLARLCLSPPRCCGACTVF